MNFSNSSEAHKRYKSAVTDFEENSAVVNDAAPSLNHMKMVLYECHHDYALVDKTLHIIGYHYLNKGDRVTPKEIRQHLKRWCAEHMDWVKDVSGPMLQMHNNYDLELYLEEMYAGDYVLDELALLLISRMYEVGICILFHDSYWTTLASDNVDQCDIFLAFRGDLTFSNLRKRTSTRLSSATQGKKSTDSLLATDASSNENANHGNDISTLPVSIKATPQLRRQGRQTKNSLRRGYCSTDDLKEMYKYIPRKARVQHKAVPKVKQHRLKMPPSYICPVSSCKETFSRIIDMNKHVAGTHPYFRYQCQYCENQYMSKYALDRHMRTHLNCPDCQRMKEKD